MGLEPIPTPGGEIWRGEAGETRHAMYTAITIYYHFCPAVFTSAPFHPRCRGIICPPSRSVSCSYCLVQCI